MFSLSIDIFQLQSRGFQIFHVPSKFGIFRSTELCKRFWNGSNWNCELFSIFFRFRIYSLDWNVTSVCWVVKTPCFAWPGRFSQFPFSDQAWDEDNSGWIDTGELRRVLKVTERVGRCWEVVDQRISGVHPAKWEFRQQSLVSIPSVWKTCLT